MEEPKGTPTEWLFMVPPAGPDLGSPRSESGPRVPAKQPEPPALLSVTPGPCSPGKKGREAGGSAYCMGRAGSVI